ncbi:hypothetical protein [Sodalis sp.]
MKGDFPTAPGHHALLLLSLVAVDFIDKAIAESSNMDIGNGPTVK